MVKQKTYKGEKYIYLLMGYRLTLLNNGSVVVGKDNGYVGGQNYYRRFTIMEYKGETLLMEKKLSKATAEFSRTFKVYGDTDKPTIQDYINEDGENAGQCWIH